MKSKPHFVYPKCPWIVPWSCQSGGPSLPEVPQSVARMTNICTTNKHIVNETLAGTHSSREAKQRITKSPLQKKKASRPVIC